MSLMHVLAMASPSAEGSSGPPALLSFLPLVLIIGVFYFLLIRPQQKQQKQRKVMIEAIKKGDRILTNGGLYATVLNVKEEIIVANIADGVKVEFSRQAVSGVVKEA